MKTKTNYGKAAIGRDVSLNTVECLVLNDLVNKLTEHLPEEFHNDASVKVNAVDLEKLAVFMAKLTGMQPLAVAEAEVDLFTLSEEDVLMEEAVVPTSSVEASDKPRVVGRIPLSREDINDLEKHS